MNTWNKVEALGVLGRDPEIRYTPNGVAVASFSIATEYSYKKNEEWVKETEWLNCTAFSKLGERIGEYLGKGSGVYVEGRIKTDKWQDKEGNDRYTTKIIVNKCDFLTNFGQGREGGNAGGNAGGNRAPEQRKQQKPKYESPNNQYDDDDIPF